jgi:Fic family protein
MRVPEKPPSLSDLLHDQNAAMVLVEAISKPEMQELIRQTNESYLHWDKFRFHQMPSKLDPKVAWWAIHMTRSAQLTPLPLSYYNGPFRYWVPPKQLEWLSYIDKKAGSYLATRSARPIPDDNDRYLFNSLMEEAIASSMLEGAVTTREVAKEMLRTKRPPRDKAEQMIVNNYKAILEIRDLKNDKLTPAMLCHFQQVLTDGTLETPEHAGRFRTSEDKIHVVDSYGDIVFSPPSAETVPDRISQLCDFANKKSTPFVHPVIKAIALHFSIGFIHPFCDGNGRTARALFYWYMLRNGYWLFEYLPLSRIIISGPAKYARAYLYAETDGGDLTYFNQYNLGVVTRAIQELHRYLEEQQKEMEKAQDLLERFPNLNLRQRLMISHALRHPTHYYTVRGHAGEYRITYNTARADLYGLEESGLLSKSKGHSGKEQMFVPAHDLVKKLAKGTNTERSRKRKKKEPEKTKQGNLFDPKLFQ